ncbi:hypothetical protein Btru_075681 [Bulinus truncatus]|nr:hypothetical protein Btru_075681 [Bulinus truncatus]
MSTCSGGSKPVVSRWPKMSLVTSSHWIDVWSSVELAGNVQRYIEHEEIRLKVITKFENNSNYEKEIPFIERRIKEFKIIHEELVKNTTDTAFKTSLKRFHPLSIFATIRNFLANWEDKLANQTVYGKRLREFLEYNVTVPLPTRQDLDKIGTAITVIQATYNLSMSDLLQGSVMDHQGELLTRSDCYDIGKTVLKAGLLDTATEWLETAISPVDLNNIDTTKLTFNLSSALTALARIAFRKNDPDKTVRLYEKAVELDPDNAVLYQDYMKHRFARNVEPIMELKREKVEPWRKTFFDTCHNTTNTTWLQEQRKLLKPNVKCRLRKSSSVPYLFYKEEVLSSVPFISLLHDFLSEREIQILKNKTLDQLNEQVMPGEVSTTMWQYKGSFFRDDHDDSIQRVSKRAGDVTNMDTVQSNTSYSLGEPLQVIDYGISGLTLPHSELNRVSEL